MHHTAAPALSLVSLAAEAGHQLSTCSFPAMNTYEACDAYTVA